MAKLPFPTRARRAGTKARRPFSGGTFIQRSRTESSEQKAIYHQVTGAGRSGVLREFFGLTDEEAQSAKTKLESVLSERIARL